MKRIALINFYFANKIPDYMPFYLSSVAYNNSIDLYLFTNLNIDNKAANIKIIKTTFNWFSDRIVSTVENEMRKKGINDTVEIKSAYKLADFRPTFGLCFQEYLNGYDFWGGCDLDLIFGNIRKYITDDILDKYDKIYEHGHFFLIRNTLECNTAFLDDFDNCFKGVLHLEKNSFFEEVYEKPWLPHGGINSIFKKRGKLYTNRKAICDISFKYNNLIDLKNPSGSNQNIFVFDQGTLYRCSLLKEDVKKQEIFYAHFQKRKLSAHTKCTTQFIIGNDAFYNIEPISIESFRITNRKNVITKKYLQFRYFDAFSRKINGDFRWR